MPHAHHHKHVRKRIHQHHQKYPSSKKIVRFFDIAIYFAGFFGLAMTIPQVMKIWVEQNAQGVSFVSWMSYLFTNVIWLGYGLVHKEKPIILTSLGWFILEIIILIGIFRYG